MNPETQANDSEAPSPQTSEASPPQRKYLMLSLVLCSIALGILWINDLITVSTEPLVGVSRFNAIEMVLVVLFFITVLSIFPAAIYVTFELQRKESNKKRILEQLKREHLLRDPAIKEQVENSFDAAYDSKKYPLPIVLVTVAVMLGWAFFFFSRGPEPIFELANSHNLTNFFDGMRNLHPVVFGFLGAFFFAMQTLLHRYFTADLKPAVFMHIAVRIWLVMILCLVLSVIWPAVPVADTGTAASETASSLIDTTSKMSSLVLLAICFIVGIIPDVALDLIQKATKKWVSNFRLAPDQDMALTQIQGLNLWHQARLAEEGIDNIQNLAESDIIDLIVYTRLGPGRLMDWIDQALLCIHAGTAAQGQGKSDWDKYKELGIHTATEFVAVFKDRFENKDTQEPQIAEEGFPSLSNMKNHYIMITHDANFMRLQNMRTNSEK